MRPAGLARAAALAAVAWMAAASAREVLTPEEQAERELEARKQAPPVLAVEPASLRARMEPGEAVALTLTVRNAGGRRLVWSVLSAPKWARLDTMSGELGFGEERKLVIVIEPDKIEPGKLPPKRGPEGGPEGAITIIAPGTKGSPAKVSVRVTLLRPPPPEPPAKPERSDRPRRRRRFAPAREKPEPPRPEPARVARPREPRPPREPGSRWRLGVRAALMLPSSGETRDYGASALLGVSLSPPEGDGSKVSYEFGLDFGGWDESGGYDSQLLGGRWGVLFALWESSRNERAYLLSGLGGFLELVEERATGDDYVNSAAALDLGAGYVFRGGQLDARFTYSIMMGSENQTGQALLSIGYGF